MSKKMKSDVRARNIMFTLFKSDQPDAALLAENELGEVRVDVGALPPLNCESWPKVQFVIYQIEKCPDTGRLHYQGYMEFGEQVRFSWIKKNVPELARAHFDERRGSQDQAIAYCTKQESRVEGPFIHGRKSSCSKQGQRKDLEAIREMIKNDPLVSRGELEDRYFTQMMRYGHAITDYKRRQTPPRNWKTITLVFYGYPGLGKSTLMKHIAPLLASDGRVYHVPGKKGSGQYYDDYDSQEVVIFDEFAGDRLRPIEFNQLADEHPCVVPSHGKAGHQFVAKYLLIGTNYLPRRWWADRSEAQIRQTIRRIDGMFVFRRKIPDTFDYRWYINSNVWKRDEANGQFVFEARSQRLNKGIPKDKEAQVIFYMVALFLQIIFGTCFYLLKSITY